MLRDSLNSPCVWWYAFLHACIMNSFQLRHQGHRFGIQEVHELFNVYYQVTV